MPETNTIIGETILIRGNLQGDEDLTVRGRVEGTINLKRTLIIEQSGVVKAEVSVSNAVISGVVVGNVTASDSVEITQSGRMVGDIHAPRVIIVEGAKFKGRVDMGELPQSRAVEAPAARRAFAPVKNAPQPVRPQAAPSRAAPPPPPPKAALKEEDETKIVPARKKIVVKKR
jgi:cytoskeletal protein CcmA (bactofilin family)